MTRLRCLFAAIVLLAVLPLSDALHAQNRPVVFLHGLFANGSTWQEAANRLSSQLAIEPHLPTTDEGAPYGVQADQVHAALGWLDSSAVAIGHSNGGLVARTWSQLRPLGGIVTVGTPHLGAPVLPNMAGYAHFGVNLLDAVYAVIDEFNADCCTWRWVLSNMFTEILNGAGAFDVSVGELVTILGLDLWHAILPEMYPGSGFLQSVNSGANVAREGADVGARVGIVSVARDFYHGGPIRAAFPEHADTLVWLRDLAKDALTYYATYLFVTAPFDDWHGWNLANRMWTAAAYLGAMDEWWCRAVSLPDFAGCWENDTVVPVWSQDYGLLGAHVGVMSEGPTHTQETSQSDDALHWALTTYMGVTGHQPDPPMPPPPPSGNDTLSAESGLFRGDALTSSDGRFRLEYGWDGNLVLNDESGSAIWWSGTWGGPGVAWMRGDGGFVIYNGDGEAVWDSGTRGDPGNWYLRVENNGTIVIYTPDGTPVWANY